MPHHDRVWSLQEAKAKFSEVVRRAQTEGPQTVTVHGRPSVTISKALAGMPEKFVGLSALQVFRLLDTGPKIDFDLPARPTSGPVRDIELP